jgi:hypothetical protein
MPFLSITDDKWAATRQALEETSGRFAGVLDTVADSPPRLTGDWSVAQTGAHVATLAQAYRAMILGSGTDELVRTTIVDTVDRLNDALLTRFAERDLRVLSRLLPELVDEILQSADDPARAIPWLGESKVPLAGVLAHLLNEFQLHGRDIARAAKLEWRVSARDAAHFFDLFVVGVTDYGYGHLLDGHGPAPRGRIAVEFRSSYTTPVTMAMTDGFVTVEKPGGRTDVRLSFDPLALNLMLFGRISKARAALTGKVVVRGRRPWILPAFLRIVHLPSLIDDGPAGEVHHRAAHRARSVRGQVHRGPGQLGQPGQPSELRVPQQRA